jgi:hypothetical protein
MQSLCTLRNHCRQWLRNTRYQADATPYLDRTFTGRIAPALRLAHLFDHLVGAIEQRLWHGDAERLCGLEINQQFDFACLLDRKVGGLLALKNTGDITASKAVGIDDAACSRLRYPAPGRNQEVRSFPTSEHTSGTTIDA